MFFFRRKLLFSVRHIMLSDCYFLIDTLNFNLHLLSHLRLPFYPIQVSGNSNTMTVVYMCILQGEEREIFFFLFSVQ